MYNRKRAYEIAVAESMIPRDKYIEYIRHYNDPSKNALKCQEIDLKAWNKLTDIYDNVVGFVETGDNLFLSSSNTGNGKSSWACRIALNYIRLFIKNQSDDVAGCPIPKVAFFNIPEFMMLKKASISDESVRERVSNIEDRLANAKLVIWDDIAYKCTSDFETQILYNLLNTRIEKRKANIFTSNVNADSMQGVVGSMIASRLMYARLNNNIVELKGKGQRGIAS